MPRQPRRSNYSARRKGPQQNLKNLPSGARHLIATSKRNHLSSTNVSRQPLKNVTSRGGAYFSSKLPRTRPANNWLYKVDPRVYRKKDYWATPAQFFNKSGDCEDYAITKYISLVHLGFDKKDMRIVIVQDLNLKVPHAVLVVYLDGKALILDNQIKQVVSASRITHYKPIYSINETKWWIHK